MKPVYVHKIGSITAPKTTFLAFFPAYSDHGIFRSNVSVVKLSSHDSNDTKKSTCELNITYGGHLMNSEDTNWKYAFFSAE